MKNLDRLSDHVSYQRNSINDEYLTISSAASSKLSLQDALFSHLSMSDCQSEASEYSDFPKIAVHAPFERPISVASSIQLIGPEDTLSIQEEAMHYEKQFCDVYMNALRCLSTNPLEALQMFEWLARHGRQVYNKLNKRTQDLVSLAQYRTGRMLYESHSSQQEQEGYTYLIESSQNGHVRATFILGFYAEQKGDLDRACQLYHQAAVLGLLPAKVAFGNILLFKKQINGFQHEDAIRMLDEASRQGHAIASLSLALYYEKTNQIEKAAFYCQHVQISPSSPIYCISQYQISIIYLKAGKTFIGKAFECMASAARADYYEEDGSLTKFTPALRKLGVLTLLGIGTAKNAAAAFQFIQEAAKYGDEPANILLGQMYLMGLGCPAVDRSRAMEIFINYQDNIAAKLSRGLLIMQENPQHAYREFIDVLRHEPTAFDQENWNIRAIKYEASVRIAIWEYNGIGGAEKNPVRAFQTLKRLSEECNYSGAYYWLAWAYIEGIKLDDGTEIVSKDLDLGFNYLLQGAKQNKADCQYCLGLMLRDGYTNQHYNKKHAFSFFLEAANLNYPPALTQVGVYYFSGSLGVENGRDLDKAFAYFTAAAKHNDSLAIQYLADYMIKNTASGPINRYQIYTELNRAAGVDRDPIAYRMLALVVNSGIDLRETYENTVSPCYPVYPDLLSIYQESKTEALMTNTDIKFRFTLHCLWKAIELQDHSSGQYLCNFYHRMSEDDIIKTIETFEKVETRVPDKLSIAYAQFLKKAKNRSSALTKFIEVASYNDVTTSIGWNSRLEAAKLIVMENQGKARSKALVFSWLNEMVKYNGKNLFIPFILLAKCHENEICANCDKLFAITCYQNALKCKSTDVSLEVQARIKLAEAYYQSFNDALLQEQLDVLMPLLELINDSSEKQQRSSDLYYYKGLLALHNGTIFNYRKKAIFYLSKSQELGNILACLELGYLYGTMEGEEEQASVCFEKVESSKATAISFKSRIIEAMVQMRTERIKTDSDYFVEIKKMKLAAGITYSYYNMERQALDWLQEISDEPLAQIMILYYKMKEPKERIAANIQRISELMSPYEAMHMLDYYGRMALSYGQFRLGQCYEHGHGVTIDHNKVLDFYSKACAFLQNKETYERLAEISDKSGSNEDLFPTLYNVSRNDPTALFRLGQYYHAKEPTDDPDVPCKKAADQYMKAAQAGHAESCYYYAKYCIHRVQKNSPINAAVKSKKAVNYLRIAAGKNHGPSFYELGKLEIAAGLYEEGVEDLKEADFLNYGAASFELGELYSNGFVGSISNQVTYRLAQNNEKSYSYYLRAIERGSPLAMIRIGSLYETGALGEINLSMAREWYTKALHNNSLSDGAAEYALGCLEETAFVNASATEQQRKSAFEWFMQACQAKHKLARFKVGCYLLNGWVSQTTPQKDIELGHQMLQEERNNGNVMAMKELARYYERLEQPQKAFDHWRKAATLTDPEAYEFIAACFEKGLLGQPVNLEEATIYRSLALDARK
ncbi:hypothetical protein EDC96DRAFT_434036 [Choanephora cucurbitarum]|nr:hypothetical protein EDC96DRAFT_434036 [Choanephora cucurbitarum]